MWKPIKNCPEYEANEKGVIRDNLTKEVIPAEINDKGKVVCVVYDINNNEIELDPDSFTSFNKPVYKTSTVKLKEELSSEEKDSNNTKLHVVEIRNFKTKEVTSFPSITLCAKALGISKRVVSYRVTSGPDFLWEDNLQYRRKDCNPNFIWPDPIYRGTSSNTVNKSKSAIVPVEIRNIKTGEVFRFKSIQEGADFLNISRMGLVYRLESDGVNVYDDCFQCRKLKGDRPWVNPISKETPACKVAQVRDIRTKEIKTFYSMSAAAEFLGHKGAWISKHINDGEWVIYHSKYQMRPYRGDTPWDDTL